tara:strand:+ start:598 stop:1056 length:459 start_codon:yes stop_codon:yes gene_type:complete
VLELGPAGVNKSSKANMSNTGKSEVGNPLLRSVEQGDKPSAAPDSSNEMASTKDISEHGYDNPNTEPKTDNSPEPDTIEVNSNGALRSPVNLSQSFSRSCSPAEQLTYQTFRSPINDSRGYYANGKLTLSIFTPDRFLPTEIQNEVYRNTKW